MNKLLRPGLLSLAVALLILVSGCGKQSDKKSAVPALENPDRDSVVFEMVARDSMTVFEILQENHSVDFKSSMIGVFIKAIDSLEQSSDAYWLYSVNGEKPKIACDKYIAAAGDTIKWHLRKTGD